MIDNFKQTSIFSTPDPYCIIHYSLITNHFLAIIRSIFWGGREDCFMSQSSMINNIVPLSKSRDIFGVTANG